MSNLRTVAEFGERGDKHVVAKVVGVAAGGGRAAVGRDPGAMVGGVREVDGEAVFVSEFGPRGRGELW